MAEAVKTRQTERSPKYPNFDLRTAMKRVQEFWDKDQGSAAPKESLAGHWGYSPKSSGFLQAIGTLKQYGLLDSTSDGLLKPSKRAISIVMLDADAPERAEAIKSSAFSPPIFAKLRKLWPDKLPSDPTMQHHLVDVLGFRPQAAKSLVSSFKNTIDFVSTLSYDSIDENNLGDESEGVEVGDFVQWTSLGVAHFETPKRVLGLSEGGDFAFVDGEKSGFPVNQLEKATPPASAGPAAPAPSNPFFTKPDNGAKEEVFALDEGQILVRWPDRLSAESYDDVKEWLKILERKIGRCVRAATDEGDDENG